MRCARVRQRGPRPPNCSPSGATTGGSKISATLCVTSPSMKAARPPARHAHQALAACCNIVLGLMRCLGAINSAVACRRYTVRPAATVGLCLDLA